MKSPSFWLAIVVVLSACLAAWALHAHAVTAAIQPQPVPLAHAPLGAEPTRFPVTIRQPLAPPLAHGVDPNSGAPVTVACMTCHATRTPNLANHATADLDLFHQGLQVEHGANTCLSCHNPQDYGSLHLANGTRVEFVDVVTLCTQCHGPQWRDFQHGAHGGMNGYWDLNRGPRERNTCTSCHDPHAPHFRGAQPALTPRDRFLEPTHE